MPLKKNLIILFLLIAVFLNIVPFVIYAENSFFEKNSAISSFFKKIWNLFLNLVNNFTKQLAQVSAPIEYLSNGGFEDIDPVKNDPIGWNDNGFISDKKIFKTGSASYRITDSHLIPYSQSASQQINLKAGIYTASIWVKLEDMASIQGSGVRICLSAPPSYPWSIARKCSQILKGTSDWQKLTIDQFSLPQDSLVAFSIETYGEPNGTAWFDDASLTLYTGPDTNPPIISIISPQANSTVSGSIVISTNASDDRGIASVRFKIDNVDLGNEILTPPYSITWDTTLFSNGQHTISAIARDTSNNTKTTSIQVIVQNIDNTPPQIYNISVSNISFSRATINWLTNEQSNSMVEYGTSTAYGFSKSDNSLVTNHSLELTNLLPATLYHYRIISQDSSGNKTISQDYTFTTASFISMPQCSDRIDNDLDGKVDYPDDPGCENPNDPEEFDVLPPPQPINGLVAGGLLWYPIPEIGPYLLLNYSFEEIGTDNKPLNWPGSAAFSSDGNQSKSGNYSYRMKDAPLFPYSESARQSVYLKKGFYRIAGWIKTELGDPNPNDTIVPCVRISLAGYSSKCLSLINDWTYVEVKNIPITEDGNYDFKLESWNEPPGQAWFDDVELRQEYQPPIEVFMLYPNYRGYLFDDGPQTIKFDVTLNPPPQTNLSDFKIEAVVIDETNGISVLTQNFTSVKNFTASLEGNNLSTGKTYLIRFKLIRLVDNKPLYEYPPYRIFKAPGSLRQSMVISFDEKNRILFRGEPKFLLGVYDSGLGYSNAESFYENTIFSDGGFRKLNELPINFYNNYWYGETPVSAMQAMSNVMQRHNVYFIHTGNCFAKTFNTSFPIYTSDNYLSELSRIPALGGFYVMDECVPELAPDVFRKILRLKAFKPDGITFGASTDPKTLSYWRDVVDLLSTDPYPLFGSEPASGYKLNQVADWTKATNEAVKGARPIATVIQYFQFTSQGRWPTKDELRNMSYMAIAEGANGLVYWSLGAGALGYICPDEATGQDLDGDGITGEYKQAVWCPQRVDYFNRLKDVVQELNALQPVLSSIDRPELLKSNSNSLINTRVKFYNEKIYLFASNYSSSTQSTVFSFNQKIGQVSVYNEGRVLSPQESNFTDSFAPYQAHVYEINFSGTLEDKEPPSPPTNLSATAPSFSEINLSWNASTDNTMVAGYKIYREGSLIATTTATNYRDTNLRPSTVYTYSVSAYDSMGNESSLSSISVITPPDSIAPIINISSPASGSTVSGDVSISAEAKDNLEIAGVQFKLDGYNIGSEDTTPPYEISLNSNQFSNGSHILTAVARDQEGNIEFSSSVPITISNPTSPPPLPSLEVSLTASPASGTSPLGSVITATVSGNFSGKINYIFYCDRPDAGVNVTFPYSIRFNNETSRTKKIICNYPSVGTFTPKVIVEGESLGAVENRTDVNVFPSSTMFFSTTSEQITKFRGKKITRTLKYGMRNEEVKILQEFLAQDKSIYPEGLITGYFGNLTRNAVKRFQTKYNIVSYGNEYTTGFGLIGPKTRAKINELMK